MSTTLRQSGCGRVLFITGQVLNCAVFTSVLLEVFADSSGEADPLMSVRSGGSIGTKVFRWDLRNMGHNRTLDIAYDAGTQGAVQSLAADPVRGHVYTGLGPRPPGEATVDCWDCNTGISLDNDILAL